ncbi:MAG: hypothetical protein ACJ72M_01445 [Propionibacteriaceae bacterium]
MINYIGKSSDQAGQSLCFSMIIGIQDDHGHCLDQLVMLYASS